VLTLAILLFALGLAFIVAEVLFPSFGVLSLLATLSILGSIWCAFLDSTTTGINFLIATGVLVPACLLVGLKLFPRSPVGKHMVVQGLSFDSTAATDERDLDLTGATGVVEAPCRPAGMARIGDRRVDVVARGAFLEVGQPVRVLTVEGNRVVVVPVGDE
jgi:membrane-bound serine protease (ClpP class)